jgi:hypothetical protein
MVLTGNSEMPLLDTGPPTNVLPTPWGAGVSRGLFQESISITKSLTHHDISNYSASTDARSLVSHSG